MTGSRPTLCRPVPRIRRCSLLRQHPAICPEDDAANQSPPNGSQQAVSPAMPVSPQESAAQPTEQAEDDENPATDPSPTLNGMSSALHQPRRSLTIVMLPSPDGGTVLAAARKPSTARIR